MVRRQVSRTTHHLASLPVLVLMPHSACNCRCVMCDIWKANANKRELTREDIARQIGSLRQLHLQRVVLTGGEALLHQNLWTLCALLRDELGVRITLLSTGLLLKAHAVDVTRWTDEVIVSLDGSREVHDAIRRVPRAFDRLAEGVAALKALRPDIPISARCVVQRQNFRDLPNVVDAAREIGLDRVSFLAVDVSSEAFNRPRPWEEARVSETALDDEETEDLAGVIERLIQARPADFASGFIAESPTKLRRLPRYFAALLGRGEFPAVSCNAPWVSTVVEADGTVRPCFFHAPFGNIHAQPLGAIVNGPEALAFRRDLDVATNPICRKCVCTLTLGRRALA